MFKKVGIIHHPYRDIAISLTQNISEEFRRHGLDVVFTLPLKGQSLASLPDDVDLVVSIGGDGTLIRVSHLVLNTNASIPIWAIAAGEFNFMPDRILAKDVEDAVLKIISGEIFTISRNVMKAHFSDTSYLEYFLNDLVIMKDKPKDILDVQVFVDDVRLGEIKGDGIIIATASGSTAYSLSAGGPIVDQDTPVYLINMINPHHITVRPLILALKRTTKICLNGSKWHVVVDGITDQVVEGSQCVIVEKTNVSLSYIHASGYYCWIDNIRTKFHWGNRYVEGSNS